MPRGSSAPRARQERLVLSLRPPALFSALALVTGCPGAACWAGASLSAGSVSPASLSAEQDANNRAAAASAAAAARKAPGWAIPREGLLRAVSEPFVSLGHAGGRYTMSVLASEPEAYLGRTPVLPGLIVCAEQREVAGRVDGPLLCMRREQEGWTFGAALPGGDTWARVGKLDDCALCHAAAPRDWLFGPP
jgi:hypothetical protein